MCPRTKISIPDSIPWARLTTETCILVEWNTGKKKKKRMEFETIICLPFSLSSLFANLNPRGNIALILPERILEPWIPKAGRRRGRIWSVLFTFVRSFRKRTCAVVVEPGLCVGLFFARRGPYLDCRGMQIF